MIALVGFKTIKREKVKFNIINIIVMGSILFVGLSEKILGFLIEIKIAEGVSISGLSLAAIVGIVLNIVLVKVNRIIKK